MKDNKIQQRFSNIYHQHKWAGRSRSGSGSDLENVFVYLGILQSLLNDSERSINSVVDLGCGDWSFSKTINWGTISYTGIDIVPELIDDLNTGYGNRKIKFIHANIVDDKLPKADLAICKDVLQHLSNKSVGIILRKLMQYKYALITNDIYRGLRMSNWLSNVRVPLQRPNTEINDGGSRPLNLTKEPFNFPAKELLCYEVKYSFFLFTKQVLLFEVS
ncbi:MAG: class I SAM-dependent methyltransferase [Xenococcaceae cyanobacterium]